MSESKPRRRIIGMAAGWKAIARGFQPCSLAPTLGTTASPSTCTTRHESIRYTSHITLRQSALSVKWIIIRSVHRETSSSPITSHYQSSGASSATIINGFLNNLYELANTWHSVYQNIDHIWSGWSHIVVWWTVNIQCLS